jgi:VRR-NUC domain.
MTPEGAVKAKTKRVLAEFEGVYYHMPVQNGMGAPTLDFVGCCHGKYFAIETKAPGKKPTERQWRTIINIRAAGGTVFVIDGSDFGELKHWLSLC